MRASSRFWDRVAERYARRPIADEASYQKKLEVTRRYLRADMTLLEFGCGTGSTAIAHAAYVRHIEAIDASANMIAIARRKAAAAGVENVTFTQSAIETLEASDRVFDAVLGLSVLHLLVSKEEVIAKVHRMLEPGGLFVTSTVCLGDGMKWFKIIAPLGTASGLMPVVRVFTKKELLDGLTRAGFEIAHQWRPGKGKAVFVVARKAGSRPAAGRRPQSGGD